MVSSTPRPHFTPGKKPVPILQEAGWAPRAGPDGRKNLVSTGATIPDRPARSQLLYRLSYPAHSLVQQCNEMKVDSRISSVCTSAAIFISDTHTHTHTPYFIHDVYDPSVFRTAQQQRQCSVNCRYQTDSESSFPHGCHAAGYCCIVLN